MKKRLLLLLCIICTLAIFVGGTMAYFTDSVNVSGEIESAIIDIEQIEMERTANNDGLRELPKNRKLHMYPAVCNGTPKADVPLTYEGHTLNFWSNVENAVDKVVFVRNDSTTTAAFRTIYAFEAYPNFEKDKVLLNRNEEDYIWTDIGLGRLSDTGDYYFFMVATYAEKEADGTVKFKSLEVDEIAPPSLLEAALSGNTSNKELEVYGDSYDILVVTQATQSKYNAPESVFSTDPKDIVKAVMEEYYYPENPDSPVYPPNEENSTNEP